MAPTMPSRKKNLEFSIAIPTYGDRSKWILNIVENCVDNPYVKQIVIVDDASSDRDFEKLGKKVGGFSKVNLCVNGKNLFMLKNKYRSMYLGGLCLDGTIEYVALIDSDNIIGHRYIDPILRSKRDQNVVFQASNIDSFDFTEFNGMEFDAENSKNYLDNANFRVMLNACNQFVHRASWLQAVDKDAYDPGVHDSLYINYCLLKYGMRIRVVPGMYYKHAVHDESTYLKRYNDFPDCSEELYQKIREL